MGILLAAGIVSYTRWRAAEQRLVQATFRLLNDSQTAWYSNPVTNYRIVVDVIRPDEVRRNEIVVKNSEIVSATVKYRKTGGLGWQSPYNLNEGQAHPFTVLGLYDMVRVPLRNNARQDIRIDMQGTPPFPHVIVFEPLWDGGERLVETGARVIVRVFEPDPD